jgi:hypothetical protein
MLGAHELSSEHLDTACDDCAALVSDLTHVNFCRRAEFNRRDRRPPLTKARVGDSQERLRPLFHKSSRRIAKGGVSASIAVEGGTWKFTGTRVPLCAALSV